MAHSRSSGRSDLIIQSREDSLQADAPGFLPEVGCKSINGELIKVIRPVTQRTEAGWRDEKVAHGCETEAVIGCCASNEHGRRFR